MPQPLPRAGDAPRRPTGTGVCPALPARGARGCSREASCRRPAEPWLAAASGTFHLPSSCQVLTGLPLRGSAKWASHSDAVPGGPSPEGSKVQTSPTGRACGERACAAARRERRDHGRGASEAAVFPQVEGATHGRARRPGAEGAVPGAPVPPQTAIPPVTTAETPRPGEKVPPPDEPPPHPATAGRLLPGSRAAGAGGAGPESASRAAARPVSPSLQPDPRVAHVRVVAGAVLAAGQLWGEASHGQQRFTASPPGRCP